MMQTVKTINYKGKPYVEVKERVRAVHEMEVPFEVLEVDFQTILDRVICKVKIRLNGSIYCGSAEAKVHNAVATSADATNPFECAETSAVGRALAFAGVGSVDGIASLDEIIRGVAPERQGFAASQETAERQPKKVVGIQPATNSSIMTIGELRTYVSAAKPSQNKQSLSWSAIVELACSDLLAAEEKKLEQVLKPGALTPVYCSQIQNFLYRLANAA